MVFFFQILNVLSDRRIRPLVTLLTPENVRLFSSHALGYAANDYTFKMQFPYL